MERVCTGCGQVKDAESEFYKQKDGRGGYMSQCRACNNSRDPSVNRLVRNRARGRAKKILMDRHYEEFQTIFEHELIAAFSEHDALTAAAARRGNADADVARIKPGPKRAGETKEDRLDIARCPRCQTHHAADHQCPSCGDITPEVPKTPTLNGRVTPAWEVREWAFNNGIECAPKGPIAREVLIRFVNANRNLPPLTPVEAADPEPVDYDEVMVARALNGDRSVLKGNCPKEKAEVVRRARLRGWSIRDIIERTGITKPDRYMSPKEEAG